MALNLRICIIVVSILFLFFVLRRIRKAQMQISDSLFWIIASIVFVIIGIFPQIVILMREAVRNGDYAFRLPTSGLLPGERALQRRKQKAKML